MSPNRIDLFQGWPSPETLPIGHLKQAATDALSNKAISADGLGYGPDEGYMPLRQNIARWLSGFYAPSQPIPADRVCITGGASQNLACILQVFTDAVYTQAVWLVEPAYHLVFRVFEDAGFHGRLRGIPEDEAGMDVGILEEALEAVDKSDGGNCQTGHVSVLSCVQFCFRRIILIPPQANQASQTIPQDIQACHLLCSDLLEPIGHYHVS